MASDIIGDVDRFKQYRLAYTMRFVRSVVLATAFLYAFIGITRFYAGDGTCIAICSLRIGIVVFILSVYAITYTEMFKNNYEYFISVYIIINSITLLLMCIISQGFDTILIMPLSLMPAAMIMIVLNYIMPLPYKLSIISGFFVSIPYLIVSLLGGTTNHIMTTFMMLLVINVLMSLNSYSNEKMLEKLWINKETMTFITDGLLTNEKQIPTADQKQ